MSNRGSRLGCEVCKFHDRTVQCSGFEGRNGHNLHIWVLLGRDAGWDTVGLSRGTLPCTFARQGDIVRCSGRSIYEHYLPHGCTYCFCVSTGLYPLADHLMLKLGKKYWMEILSRIHHSMFVRNPSDLPLLPGHLRRTFRRDCGHLW